MRKYIALVSTLFCALQLSAVSARPHGGAAASGGGSQMAAPTNVVISWQGGTGNTGQATTTGNANTAGILNWTEGSGDTNGTNIYRATEAGGTSSTYNGTGCAPGDYSLLTTVAHGTATYTDSAATNANYILAVGAAPIYCYQLSTAAVGGNTESSKINPNTYWYQAGVSNQSNDHLSFNATPTWNDTTHTQSGSTADIKIAVTSSGGGFQPSADTASSPHWNFELGAPGNVEADFYIGSISDGVGSLALSRPGGTGGTDLQPHSGAGFALWTAGTGVSSYCGPKPFTGPGTISANTWFHCKIPFTAYWIGVTQFQGNISGTTLNVCSITSGPGIDSASVITSTAVSVTAGTFINVTAPQTGAGAYTVNNSQTVGSACPGGSAMTAQRTSIYKISFYDKAGTTPTFFMDNIQFTYN